MPEKIRARMLDKEADMRLNMNKREEEKYKRNDFSRRRSSLDYKWLFSKF